jgi:hypothetical protein
MGWNVFDVQLWSETETYKVRYNVSDVGAWSETKRTEYNATCDVRVWSETDKSV